MCSSRGSAGAVTGCSAEASVRTTFPLSTGCATLLTPCISYDATRAAFVLTVSGREIDGDAEELWQHLVANLPQGDTAEERMAGALWLLTLRAGRSTYGLYDRHAAVLFGMIARQSGDRGPTDQQVHQWHLPTLRLLLVLQQTTTLGARPEQCAAAWDALWGARPEGS